MSCLFVVNKNLSARTGRFWKKHQALIESRFPESSFIFPKSLDEDIEKDISGYEIIAFIGDDTFFSRITNLMYNLLTENHGRNILAYIPDSAHSALADGLGLPRKIESCLDLLKNKHTLPLDIIRCHFVDIHGFPSSSLVLNDAVIGLPRLNPTDIVKRVTRPSPKQKNLKQITLVSEQDTVYEGCYSVAAILLGRKITRGLKLRSKRIRTNLTKFEYVQLNTQAIRNFPAYIPDLLSGKSEDMDKGVLSKKFSELEMKGFGEENRIIADGVYLGRLPATFTLLPKALRVISPLVVKPVKKPWRENLTATVPKPIINREIQTRQVSNSRSRNGV